MILVTGGTGFLGLHLIAHLLSIGETSIKAIYRSPEKLNYARKTFLTLHPTIDATELWRKITWVKGDILDIPGMETVFTDCKQVYHCAGYISFIPNEFSKLKKINIEGTANLVNLSLKHKITKFCYVSSIITLNKNPDEDVLTEDSQWNNEIENSGYAISKHGGEMEIWRGIQEGLPAVIVNPGVILGSGFYDSGSGTIFKNVKKGVSFYTSGSSAFVGVTDCVRIMHSLMAANIFKERFILIAENSTYKNILHKIAAATSAKPATKKAPPLLLKLAAYFQHFGYVVFGIMPKLPLDMITSLSTTSTYSNQKIVQQLDYTFESIDSVIERVATHFNRLQQE